MKRIHVFEVEDLTACPEFIRESITEFLAVLLHLMNPYQVIYSLILELIIESEASYILDLCSGSGGTLRRLSCYLRENKRDVRIYMTDLYLAQRHKSNHLNDSENIFYYEKPVNALNVSLDLPGIRTMFTAFHHFKWEDAKKILNSAIQDNRPIAIFEFTERSFLGLARTILGSWLIFVFAPFFKKVTIKKIIFIYFVPIIPVCLLWDSIISALRTYRVDELQKMVNEVDLKGTFDWSIGKRFSWRLLGNITYFIGRPKH